MGVVEWSHWTPTTLVGGPGHSQRAMDTRYYLLGCLAPELCFREPGLEPELESSDLDFFDSLGGLKIIGDLTRDLLSLRLTLLPGRDLTDRSGTHCLPSLRRMTDDPLCSVTSFGGSMISTSGDNDRLCSPGGLAFLFLPWCVDGLTTESEPSSRLVWDSSDFVLG